MFDGNVLDCADRPDELRSLLDETGLALISLYTGANFVYSEILPDELYRVRRRPSSPRGSAPNSSW
jgi:inosose dehydratase